MKFPDVFTMRLLYHVLVLCTLCHVYKVQRKALSSAQIVVGFDSFHLFEGGERYVALFPYTGQYEDELSFEVT